MSVSLASDFLAGGSSEAGDPGAGTSTGVPAVIGCDARCRSDYLVNQRDPVSFMGGSRLGTY